MTVLIIIDCIINVPPGRYMFEKTIKLHIQQGFQFSRIGETQVKGDIFDAIYM